MTNPVIAPGTRVRGYLKEIIDTAEEVWRGDDDDPSRTVLCALVYPLGDWVVFELIDDDQDATYDEDIDSLQWAANADRLRIYSKSGYDETSLVDDEETMEHIVRVMSNGWLA